MYDSFIIYTPPRRVILRDDQPEKEKWQRFFDSQYEHLKKRANEDLSPHP